MPLFRIIFVVAVILLASMEQAAAAEYHRFWVLQKPDSIRAYQEQQELTQIRQRIANRAYLNDTQVSAAEDVDGGGDDDGDAGDDDEAEAAKLRAEVAALKKELNGRKTKQKKVEEDAPPPEEPEPSAAEDTFEKKSKKGQAPAPYFNGKLATLTPFGREDVGRELTERSIYESDRMVDQIEKAEVAEEKRAVYRALTRLRGAAINSFDGVAHSQVGNIDEYAATHNFREQHPVKHLAHEESDIKAWAFPNGPTNEDDGYSLAQGVKKQDYHVPLEALTMIPNDP